jgi:ligand-binding sensor domain-containing protein
VAIQAADKMVAKTAVITNRKFHGETAMKKVICECILFILIVVTPAIAQEPNLWTIVTEVDGLINNNVTTLAESNDGAIWLGTAAGASRYEAGTWTNFTQRDGLADDRVYAVHGARDGTVWFGTANGLSRYQNGRWKNFSTADGLVNNAVLAIMESTDGTLWFGTEGGASHFQAGTWTSFTTANSSLADNRVQVIAESKDGAIWFGTEKGLSQLTSGVWQTYTTAVGLIGNNVQALLESRSNVFYVGTTEGVSQYVNGIWSTVLWWEDNRPLTFNTTSICESQDGSLWFGSDFHVRRYHNGKWEVYYFAEHLPAPEVNAIIESSYGAVWIGTIDGVSRYQEPTWKIFSETEGLLGTQIYDIIESQDGALWIGTDEGVNRYYAETWTNFTPQNSNLIDRGVYAIRETRDGALWFGTVGDVNLEFGGGLSRYQNGNWTNFTAANGLIGNKVYAIYESSDSSLWIGGNGGFSRYKNGEWTKFRTILGRAVFTVLSIAEANDGAIWVALAEGVRRYPKPYQAGNWQPYTESNSGLINDVVTSVLKSGDGALWFGTFAGVNRYQDGKWESFTKKDGLADNIVRVIMQASDGAIWFGTEYGVSRYQNGTWETLTESDGLGSQVVFAIGESKNGNMWFGGIFRVTRLLPDRNPPFTFFDETPPHITGTSTPLFIFHGADYFAKPEQLSYAYAVANGSALPDDNRWTSFSKRTSIQPPLGENGTYTFYARARDSWGNSDPTPAAWTFTVDVTQPTVTINSPVRESVVAGRTAIVGSAFDSSPLQDFKNYQLRFGYGTACESIAAWQTNRFVYKDTTQAIRNDTLAIWNTEGLENGFYCLHLSAYDTLGHESHDYVKVEVVKAIQEVNSRRGSNFFVGAGQLEIYIPPNAVLENVQLNVRECQDIVPKAAPQLTFANLCFEIAPRELRLEKPATLTLHYPDSALTNKNEKKLAIYYSVNGKENWQRLGGSVDVEKNKIITTFKQAGVFALYEDLSTGGKAGILNVTSQPRVFSPQGGGFNTQTAISFDLGKEANVTIKIYNAAGRLVRVLTENAPMSYGTQVKYWDGKDQSGHYCLSGLHLVTVQAEDKMVTKTVVVLNK